ncbi:unnamed protein product, partial [Mesorhabditis belari]|uniref:Uncharacterized protein n=1 Tax=Mesorhabditis belari TaxID=2138241 RepID=A0AAF3FA23_9BILA
MYLYLILIFICEAFASGDDAGAPPPVHESFYFTDKLKAFEFRKEESPSEEASIIEYIGSEMFSHNSTQKGMKIKINYFDNVWSPIRFHGPHHGSDYFELLEKSHKPLEYVVPNEQVFMEYTQETGEFKGSIKEVDIKEGCNCAQKVESPQNGSIITVTIRQRISKGCPPIACAWEPLDRRIERFITIEYSSNLNSNDTFYIRVNNKHRELLKMQQEANGTLKFQSKLFQSRIFLQQLEETPNPIQITKVVTNQKLALAYLPEIIFFGLDRPMILKKIMKTLNVTTTVDPAAATITGPSTVAPVTETDLPESTKTQLLLDSVSDAAKEFFRYNYGDLLKQPNVSDNYGLCAPLPPSSTLPSFPKFKEMSAVWIVLIALGGTFLFLFVAIVCMCTCCRRYCWCPDLGGGDKLHIVKPLEE